MRAFAGRVAFRARRQITKTKPSIREDRGTGAFHRLTRRPHACPSTRAHTAERHGVWLALFEPGSLWSRLRFGVMRPRSKRKRNRLPGCSGGSSTWAPRTCPPANDLHALEIGLPIGHEPSPPRPAGFSIGCAPILCHIAEKGYGNFQLER